MAWNSDAGKYGDRLEITPMIHRNSLANLRPAWRRGQSGNPAGRPKGISLRELIRHIADEPAPDDPRKSNAERLIETAFERAISGDARYLLILFKYLDDDPRDREVHQVRVVREVSGVDLDAVLGTSLHVKNCKQIGTDPAQTRSLLQQDCNEPELSASHAL